MIHECILTHNTGTKIEQLIALLVYRGGRVANTRRFLFCIMKSMLVVASSLLVSTSLAWVVSNKVHGLPDGVYIVEYADSQGNNFKDDIFHRIDKHDEDSRTSNGEDREMCVAREGEKDEGGKRQHYERVRVEKHDMAREMEYGRINDYRGGLEQKQEQKPSKGGSGRLRRRGGHQDVERIRADFPKNRVGPPKAPKEKHPKAKGGDDAGKRIDERIPFAYDRMSCNPGAPSLPLLPYRMARDGLLRYCDQMQGINPATRQISFSKNGHVLVYMCNTHQTKASMCFRSEYTWLESNVFDRECGSLESAYAFSIAAEIGYGRAWAGESICQAETSSEVAWKGMPDPIAAKLKHPIEQAFPGSSSAVYFDANSRSWDQLIQPDEDIQQYLADPAFADESNDAGTINEKLHNEEEKMDVHQKPNDEEIDESLAEEVWRDMNSTSMLVPEKDGVQYKIPTEPGTEQPGTPAEGSSGDDVPEFLPVAQRDGSIELMPVLRHPETETTDSKKADTKTKKGKNGKSEAMDKPGMYDRPAADKPIVSKPANLTQTPSTETTGAEEVAAEAPEVTKKEAHLDTAKSATREPDAKTAENNEVDGKSPGTKEGDGARQLEFETSDKSANTPQPKTKPDILKPVTEKLDIPRPGFNQSDPEPGPKRPDAKKPDDIPDNIKSIAEELGVKWPAFDSKREFEQKEDEEPFHWMPEELTPEDPKPGSKEKKHQKSKAQKQKADDERVAEGKPKEGEPEGKPEDKTEDKTEDKSKASDPKVEVQAAKKTRLTRRHWERC